MSVNPALIKLLVELVAAVLNSPKPDTVAKEAIRAANHAAANEYARRKKAGL